MISGSMERPRSELGFILGLYLIITGWCLQASKPSLLLNQMGGLNMYMDGPNSSPESFMAREMVILFVHVLGGGVPGQRRTQKGS